MIAEPHVLSLSKHAPEAYVALGAPSGPLSASRTRADLLTDVANVAVHLPQLGAEEVALLVFRQDRYAFAVALLAVWSRGYAACLPPNQRGATVSELLAPNSRSAKVSVLLHDTGAVGHFSVPELLAENGAVPRGERLSHVNLPTRVAVSVMTSGSTGQSVAWNKSAAQLLDEVAVLAETFDAHPGLAYAVTVPPSHLYGLLFGVLLPLVTGGAFTRNTPLLPGEIAASVAHARAQVLVSVPTHLRAVRSLAPDSLATVSRVFSSAGPLPEETARAFTSRHQRAITEIFGSTETGGIAWRERRDGAAWRPFGPVRLATTPEHLLVVQSPFTNSNTAEPSTFATSDRVNLLPDGKFEHLGRHDGVVKIGGQRISVPAMEDCLMQHPEVEDVAVLALADDVRGHRLLAAVSGAPHLEESCRELLLSQFELSTLPRRFLFLDKLPREANGKLMRGRLLRLFGLDDAGAPLTKTLAIDPVTSERTVRATIAVPRDYIGYSGHFEQYAVMAGAIQLQYLVLPVLRSARPDWTSPSELRRIKFMGRIEPGDTIDVELTLGERDCEFVLKKGDKVCSAGALVFAGGESNHG